MQFLKDANKRILLCAHWDSRFTADNDTKDIEKPILGANDGGSGVGVLLEIARQLSLSPIQVGVDIVFLTLRIKDNQMERIIKLHTVGVWGRSTGLIILILKIILLTLASY